jgi:hypothetical protein
VVLLLLVPITMAGGAAAQPHSSPAPPPPPIAIFTGARIVGTTTWDKTPYKTFQTAVADWGNYGGIAIPDRPVPIENPGRFRIEGTGGKCRLVMSVFLATPNGWSTQPTSVWAFTADKLPYDYSASHPIFFATPQKGGNGNLPVLVTIGVSSHQPRGTMCAAANGTWQSSAVLVSDGHYRSLLKNIPIGPLQLQQVWPGPTTQGVPFQLTVNGWGPTSGDVRMTLSGPAYPNAAHAGSAVLTMMPTPAAQQSGKAGFPSAFPATLSGNTATAFPDLARLGAGRYRFRVNFEGLGEVVGHPAPLDVEVDVAKAPKENGATITSIAPAQPGFFTGQPQQLTVSGSPGTLGTCDSYKLKLTPIGSGAGQTLTFTNKAFPQTLVGGADFTTLGAGLWDAAVTSSGALCTGSADAVVEIDGAAPAFADRPTLAIDVSQGSQAVISATLPPTYAGLANAASIGCCDADLYVQSASGSWSSAGGVTRQNYGDPVDQPDGSQSFQGVIPVSALQALGPSGATFAMRVRANGTGQTYAWSNVAIFTGP